MNCVHAVNKIDYIKLQFSLHEFHFVCLRLEFCQSSELYKRQKRSSIVLKSFCPISVSYVVSEIKKKETEALCHYSESSNIKVNKWHQLQLCSGHNVLVWSNLFSPRIISKFKQNNKTFTQPPTEESFWDVFVQFSGAM